MTTPLANPRGVVFSGPNGAGKLTHADAILAELSMSAFVNADDIARGLAAQAAQKSTYQGEVLNFESPGHFFGQLTEKRTALVRTAQGKGELSVRVLARLVDRDVKRVHEDVVVLADLGLLERTESGGMVCPYSSMHIDMVLKAA
jgi:predicted transcriptional regulator